MSTNTLETAYANGEIIDASHVNELTLALLGAFVGRNSSGIPTTGQSLGTLALPWGNIYGAGLILNGVALDTSNIVSSPNRIVSGKARSLSTMPDFLRANGAALSFQILGATTNLVLSINNAAVTVNTDITKTGFTAAPSTNNTCLVNDTTMSNDKYAGEEGHEIVIDTVGSEITAKVGQLVALKNGTEIMLAYVKNATTLSNVYRGFFFDSAGAPLVRANLSDNSTLTLLSLGWIFVEDNGTTVDVSYKTPVVSYTSPSSPATGDYWYDLSNNVWKRYSGTTFEIINRMLIGCVAADTTACIGARSFDFHKAFSDSNNCDVTVSTTEIAKLKDINNKVSVYGTELFFQNSFLQWNITTNLESPLTEAASTMYYLYLSDQGQAVISDERPYHRPDLKGYYHPYHSWRCLGEIYNDASSNIVYAQSFKYNPNIKVSAATVKETQNTGVAPASGAAGAWNTRVLNTKNDPNGILISMASNQVMLAPGKYHIRASFQSAYGSHNKARFRNITKGATTAISGNGWGMSDTSCHPIMTETFTIRETCVFEFQHYNTNAHSANHGQAVGATEKETYVNAEIMRIA